MKSEIFFRGGGSVKVQETARKIYFESTVTTAGLCLLSGFGDKKIIVNMSKIIYIKDL